MSAVNICEARGNLDVDLVLVVGPFDCILLLCKNHRRPPIRHHEEAADIVALVVLLPTPELAQGLALEEREPKPLEAGQRLQHAGVDLHHALVVHWAAGTYVVVCRLCVAGASADRPLEIDFFGDLLVFVHFARVCAFCSCLCPARSVAPARTRRGPSRRHDRAYKHSQKNFICLLMEIYLNKPIHRIVS